MLLHSNDSNDKEILHAILSTIDEGIHAVDASGVTIFYNHVAKQHDGLEGEEILGKHLLKVFPSLTVDTSTLLKVIETGEPIYNQQQSYYNIRGKLIDTVNTTLPIVVHDKVVGAVEIAKDLTKIKQLSEKLVELRAKVEQTTEKNKPSKSHTGAVYHTPDIISNDPVLMRVKEKIHKVAVTSSPILVYGETGTGKELVVQSIHNASQRRERSFIAQNCAAIPANLLEGILFGTVKGSYTGAVDRPGLFELADGGTLFLDELHAMPIDIQVKLLRVLENGMVRRVGSTKETSLNVRVIAALNEPPETCLENKTLRPDLYYRLNVVHFDIPPLRDRKGDIPILVEHFMKKFNFRFGKLVTNVADEVYQALNQCYFPGNIRELEHAVEAAMNMVEEDTLRVEHLPEHIANGYRGSLTGSTSFSLNEVLQRKEKELISQAMKATKGNVLQAAKQLQIPRQTLQYKLAKLDLE